MNKKIDINKINGIIKTSNFYKFFYGRDKFQAFEDIPYLNKKNILNDQMKNPPFGSNCADYTKAIRIHRTSGTTQTPLFTLLSDNDVKNNIHTGSKAYKLSSMGKGDIVFNCLNYCMWMGGFMDHLSMEDTGACIVPYGVGNTENLIENFLLLKGACLHSTPSYLSAMKKILDTKFSITPKELNIRKGFFGGESGMQNQSFRKNIEEEWGMSAYNANYGLSEVYSIIGGECYLKNGLHFTASDFLHVELIEEKDNSLSPKKIIDNAIGELVVTHLNKELQPLIRYRTGDIIKIISTNKCVCGEDSFKFNVIGRKDDMIVVRGINFFPETLIEVFNDYKELTGNYKVIISKEVPLENVNVIVEINDIKKASFLKSEIKKTIKSKLFISVNLDFVEKLDVKDGNKHKILERV